MADARRGGLVGPERGLTVGSCRHEVESAVGAEDAGAEAAHEVSTLVFQRQRRHGHEHVIGQQGHQRFDVGRLVGAEALLLGGRSYDWFAKRVTSRPASGPTG